MKIKLESTTKVVEVNGIPARIWEGETESGIKVHAFINRVAVHKDESPEVHNQFKTELQECKQPSSDVTAYPLRMIL